MSFSYAVFSMTVQNPVAFFSLFSNDFFSFMGLAIESVFEVLAGEATGPDAGGGVVSAALKSGILFFSLLMISPFSHSFTKVVIISFTSFPALKQAFHFNDCFS